MINKSDLLDYFEKNYDREFSKEEIINTFSKSIDEESIIDQFLSEMEVESTFAPSNLFVNCKAGTVYYKWNKSI